MISATIYSCIMLAASSYNINPTMLYGIYKNEGGSPGYVYENTNDTQDLGVMQINTVWLPKLSKKWDISEDTTRKLLRDDACLNVKTAAWILKGHLNSEKNPIIAIGNYHSKTPHLNLKYRTKFLANLEKEGLIKGK